MNKNDIRQTNGITLIALIITIIVMLLLVAVTITIAVNGGLFNYARQAKMMREIARYTEELEQARTEAKIQTYIDDVDILTETRERISNNSLFANATIGQIANNQFTVTTEEGYVFAITRDSVTYLNTVSAGNNIQAAPILGQDTETIEELDEVLDIYEQLEAIKEQAMAEAEENNAELTQADLVQAICDAFGIEPATNPITVVEDDTYTITVKPNLEFEIETGTQEEAEEGSTVTLTINYLTEQGGVLKLANTTSHTKGEEVYVSSEMIPGYSLYEEIYQGGEKVKCKTPGKSSSSYFSIKVNTIVTYVYKEDPNGGRETPIPPSRPVNENESGSGAGSPEGSTKQRDPGENEPGNGDEQICLEIEGNGTIARTYDLSDYYVLDGDVVDFYHQLDDGTWELMDVATVYNGSYVNVTFTDYSPYTFDIHYVSRKRLSEYVQSDVNSTAPYTIASLIQKIKGEVTKWENNGHGDEVQQIVGEIFGFPEAYNLLAITDEVPGVDKVLVYYWDMWRVYLPRVIEMFLDNPALPEGLLDQEDVMTVFAQFYGTDAVSTYMECATALDSGEYTDEEILIMAAQNWDTIWGNDSPKMFYCKAMVGFIKCVYDNNPSALDLEHTRPEAANYVTENILNKDYTYLRVHALEIVNTLMSYMWID